MRWRKGLFGVELQSLSGDISCASFIESLKNERKLCAEEKINTEPDLPNLQVHLISRCAEGKNTEPDLHSLIVAEREEIETSNVGGIFFILVWSCDSK